MYPNTPDLLSIQRKSFLNFLQEGLIKEIDDGLKSLQRTIYEFHFNEIQSNIKSKYNKSILTIGCQYKRAKKSGKEYTLVSHNFSKKLNNSHTQNNYQILSEPQHVGIKLKKPILEPKKALQQGGTYETEIFVPIIIGGYIETQEQKQQKYQKSLKKQKLSNQKNSSSSKKYTLNKQAKNKKLSFHSKKTQSSKIKYDRLDSTFFELKNSVRQQWIPLQFICDNSIHIPRINGYFNKNILNKRNKFNNYGTKAQKNKIGNINELISDSFYTLEKNLSSSLYNEMPKKVGYISLGNLPLLTEEGYFVINGTRRILMNQIIRSPNVYCKLQFHSKNRRRYIISFVSERGVWLRIERDLNQYIWVRINNYPKIPLFVFLRALGITNIILSNTFDTDTLWQSLKLGDPADRKTALTYLGWIFRKGKRPLSVKQTREFLHEKLFHPRFYSFALSGRQSINKKFTNLFKQTTLCPEDILIGIQTLLGLESGYRVTDDIDHLKNKKVRLINELVQNQFRRSFKRLEEELNRNTSDKIIKQNKNSTYKNCFYSSFPNSLRLIYQNRDLMQNNSYLADNLPKVSQYVFVQRYPQRVKNYPLSSFEHFIVVHILNSKLSTKIEKEAVKHTSNQKYKNLLYTSYQSKIEENSDNLKYEFRNSSNNSLEYWNLYGFFQKAILSGIFIVQNTKETYQESDILSNKLAEKKSILNSFLINQKRLITKEFDFTIRLYGETKVSYTISSLSNFNKERTSKTSTDVQKTSFCFMPLYSVRPLFDHVPIDPILSSNQISEEIFWMEVKNHLPQTFSLNDTKINAISNVSKVNFDTIANVYRDEYPVAHFMKFQKPFSSTFREFFGLNPLSQFMDQVNPLGELTQKRRLSSLGPGGVSREAGLAVRDIHPSHYGRICPIETPEGKNAGLVNSLASHSIVNIFGFLKTGYEKFPPIQEKIIGNFISFSNCKTQPYIKNRNINWDTARKHTFLHAEQEEKYSTTPYTRRITASEDILDNLETMSFIDKLDGDVINDTSKKISSNFEESDMDKIICRYNKSVKREFPSQIKFSSISPVSMVSVATSLIPFLEHDDGNRALMGSNMQRQGVPLVFSEIPRVGTGMESHIGRDSRTNRISNISGVITYCDCQTIEICSNNYTQFQLSKEGSIRTNQNTIVQTQPCVEEGEAIREGDLLAEGISTKKGELSIGRNLFLGYLPWEGYNFEDAIILNQRVVEEHCLTTLHLEQLKVATGKTENSKESGEEFYCPYLYPQETYGNENDIMNIQNRGFVKQLKNYAFDVFGIIKPGVWVEQGSVLACKRKTAENKIPITPEEKLLYDIFTQTTNSNQRKTNSSSKGRKVSKSKSFTIEYKDTSYVLSHDIQGRILQTYFFPEGQINPSFFKFINQFRITDLNKVNKHIDEDYISSIYSKKGTVIIYILIKRPIQIGDKIAGRHGNKGIVSNILPKEDMPFLPNGTPLDILLNPLGVPSRMNVGQVYECILGIAGEYLHENYRVKPFDETQINDSTNLHEVSRAFVYKKLQQASEVKNYSWLFHPNQPGKVRIFDGRSGEVLEHSITVGVSYILKLVHLVDEKMHARSTGPYSLITEQPLKGRSKHGGQRVGEMEVWAFEGYGASYLLQEMMTIKSDDIYGRNQAFLDILRRNPVKKGSVPESFRVLAYELRSLCFDIFYTLKT